MALLKGALVALGTIFCAALLAGILFYPEPVPTWLTLVILVVGTLVGIGVQNVTNHPPTT